MNAGIDSLDLTANVGPLPGVNLAPPGRLPMRRTRTTDPETGEERAVYTAGKKHLSELPDVFGVTGIMASETGVSLRLTGQALGPRYSEGFTAETLPLACEMIARTGYLAPEPDELLRCLVTRADAFTDLPSAEPHDMAEALRLLGSTGGRGVRLDPKSKGDAVTVYATLPNRAGLLRWYYKDPERGQLRLAKHRPFLDAFPEVRDTMANVFRAEVEGQNAAPIRNAAGLPSGNVILSDLFDSERTPVSDALDGVLSRWTERTRTPNALPSMPRTLDAFLSGPGGSFSDDAYRLLAVYIVDLVDGNYAEAEAVLRAKYGPKNWHRYRRHVLAAVEARHVAESGAARGPAADREPIAPAVRLLTSFAGSVRKRETVRA